MDINRHILKPLLFLSAENFVCHKKTGNKEKPNPFSKCSVGIEV